MIYDYFFCGLYVHFLIHVKKRIIPLKRNNPLYLSKNKKDQLSSVFFNLKLLLYLFETVGADALVVEIHNVVGVAAKYARGLIFLKNDLVIVGEDLHSVTFFVDVHIDAKFFWKNYSAKLVDRANDSR